MITIVIISLVVSMVSFRMIRGFKVACFVSTAVSSLLSWVVLQDHFGWFDRVFYENASMTVLFAFGTSLAVGAWLSWKRRIDNKEDTDHTA